MKNNKTTQNQKFPQSRVGDTGGKMTRTGKRRKRTWGASMMKRCDRPRRKDPEETDGAVGELGSGIETPTTRDQEN